MAVESGFSTLFEKLKLDDPWLPPKTWESIPSESGRASSTAVPTSAPSQCSFYDVSSVSGQSLVRLAMYALQGCQSSLLSIQKLSESFCSFPADRSANRIPSLWNQSLSTHALGRILKSIGSTGSMVLFLHKFVEYFTSLCVEGITIEKQNEGSKNLDACSARSLVNQAFAVAVGKVLQGYTGAISTVDTSALLRRSGNKVNVLPFALPDPGNLTSIPHSGLTLLEVYLHTKEMRTQIEALGNVCCLYDASCSFSVMFLDYSDDKAAEVFSKFPRGGDLLSYLYNQLLVADPVHIGLLKFLFCRSLEPYCRFIYSWIYEAKIDDPYGEYVIGYERDLTHGKVDMDVDISSVSVQVRDGISTPCFLKDFTVPLLRAGQQLQVVLKLLKLCKYITTGEYTLDDVLPGCSGFPINGVDYAAPLSFNGKEIEDRVSSRKNFYRIMLKKLEHVMRNFKIKYHQVVCFYHFPLLGTSKLFRPFLVRPNTHFSLALDIVDRSKPSALLIYGAVDSCIPWADGSNLSVIRAELHGAVKINIGSAGIMDTRSSFAFDETLISSDAAERDSNKTPHNGDSDTSSMDEWLSYPLDSSECLSTDGSEGQDDCLLSTELPDGLSTVERNYMSALHFSSIRTVNGCAQEPFLAVKPRYVDGNHLETQQTFSVSSHCVDPYQKEVIPKGDSETSSGLSDSPRPWIHKLHYADLNPSLGWPVGGLLENPLGKWIQAADDGSHISPNYQCGSSFDFYNAEESSSINRSPSCLSHIWGIDDGMEAEKCSLSNSYVLQPWNVKTLSNALSMNPMLTRNIYINNVRKAGSVETSKLSKNFPYFAFSSVKNPLELYESQCPDILEDQPRLSSSGASDVQHKEGCPVKKRGQSVITMDKDKTVSKSSITSKNASVEYRIADLKGAVGGSAWESLLHNHHMAANQAIQDQESSPDAVFELPLDFIISTCVLQEILLQYNYISRLTIKLLEEGFDLKEHLLTLRRYHFMEIADWANLFVRSLWHHKWYFREAAQRIPEIQGLLESSIQRSSCEQNLNKDRLYIYVKNSSAFPVSSDTIGIHSFSFIGLGYRVDWPISIILNPNALRLYAEIFSFLIQVKLAVHSLTDLWFLVKEYGHFLNRKSQQHGMRWIHFTLLTKLRHQLYHFVSTLQQYVLSQLSDVSWCRFIHSLQHQVKDMIDLESAHMAYLSDSLHICFLSDETQSTLNIIRQILQCALDFHSCLADTGVTDHKNVTENLLQVTNPQLLSVRQKFEKSMKELHLLYLESPKHEEFGLSRFWSYLDYNNFYSDTFTKEMPLYSLSV